MVEISKTTSSTGLYEAAIGERNQAYYLDKFEQFDEKGDGFHISWNWAAFFFSGFWALSRKMYRWFFAMWVFAVIINMVEKLNVPPAVGLLFLAPGLCFAIFGNSLYHRKVKAQIASAQKSDADELKVIRRLNSSGGVHTWVLYAVGVIPVIGIVAAIAIPAFQNTAKFDSSTAKPWDKYSPNDNKQPQEAQWGKNDKLAPVETDWANGTITPPQNSQIEAFLNQPPKANPFDQFDEKSSQTLAPEHLAKRKIILEKMRLKELLEINGATTAGMPENAISWSTSNTLDLERNQTPFRYDKTRFNTHIVNNSSNNLSVIGFDFKESNCSDNTKSNRFFVNLERPISSGSAAVVNFIMPESLVSKGGNFCLDIVSAWN